MTKTARQTAARSCAWTDCGIARCTGCRSERRVYAPQHNPSARLCQPCAKQWSIRELNR
jgi:hypothetical protein